MASLAIAEPFSGEVTAAAPRTHYLLPSALFVSDQPHLVTTVLGTCVSVCLWDRVLCIGGINHFMLPLWNGTGPASPKYGNVAVSCLIERMAELGSRPANLIAKLFGGKSNASGPGFMNVGKRNVDVAEQMIEEAGIKVTARSLGGAFGRKLIYNTETGSSGTRCFRPPHRLSRTLPPLTLRRLRRFPPDIRSACCAGCGC